MRAAGGGGERRKMTLRLVSILSMALLFVLPAQLDAFITQNTGCLHNGTWYADKSVVPSMEKCLNCQCNRKTLVCRLKVCPEMPMPPPRGCVVVQKKNTCCPYLSCARLDAFYKIPTKRRIIAYLDHYERESIDRVVNDNMLQRRSDDSDVDLFVCVKNGTVYKSGSAMSSSNLCSYCYCIGGTEKCVKPKCMLPVEGCKPIFVDSTCCPVRYDCSSKTSGKSSQEVRYRKTSNKHFQRMSQRLQRNRGCTVGSQFYAEGQKMRSDADKPCDICFCIRGTRRCAPKKCSPALKNCIPVVPKGQCCPSSYDCGSQRDYRRSQSSRQFNLYNLLFGKEEQEAEAAAAAAMMPSNTMAEHYPLDRHPSTEPTAAGDALQASSEKSIMDTLREGLEFIDGNNNQMLASNMDLVTAAPPVTRSPLDIDSTTAELSFLDLLLGPSTETPAESTTTTTTAKKPLSWVDLLLGPDEDEPAVVSEPTMAASTAEPSTSTLSSIKRFADDFNDELGSDEIAVGELPAEAQHIGLLNEASSTAKPPNLLNVLLDGLSDMLDDNATTTTTTTPSSSSSSSTTTTTRSPSTVRAPPMFRPLSNHKATHNRINSKLANLTVTPPMLLVTSKYGQPVTSKTVASSSSSSTASSTTSTTSTTTTTTAKPSTTSTTPKPSSTTRKSTSTPRSTTTAKPKPKSSRRTTTTTAKPSSSSTTTTIRSTLRHKTSPHFSSSPKPVIIQTNPSILEAEPLDDDGDSTAPTLPPSLPNLKIIPFLPTDAVNTVAKLPHASGYYASSPEAADKMDTNFEGLQYPAITSDYPQQASQDQAAYKYQFNVEVPVAEPPPEPVVHVVGGEFKGSADYVSYEFDQHQVMPVVPAVHSGFSPPTETEGGFMPKEPLVIDGEVLQDHVTSNVLHSLADNYHVTQHIIDITTSKINDTASIEITTPDPFKDVIHTERPPNLDALIVDKQHKQPTKQQQQQLQLQHTESVTYSISNSSGFKAPAATTTTTAATTTTTTTLGTKQTLLIDKNEINNLDQLLDELLAMELPSTVPPFRTLPTLTSTKAAAATTTAAATSTAAAATRPTIRGNKKGSKPKGKPAATANRRNNAPTTVATKPSKSKVQAATRRTTAASSSSNSSSNNNRNSTLSLTSVKSKSTAAATSTSTTTTAMPAPTTTAAITTRTTTTTTTTTVEPPATIASSTMHPILMSPFDKLPFIDTSYEVRPHMLQPQQQQQQQQQQLLQEQPQSPQQFHHYQHAPSSSSSTTTTAATTAAATPTAAEGDSNTAAAAATAGGGGGADNLMNPTGMLKLAGCNIYGRMYRVGRIIVELSNQCLECKCTEVGVKCGPLDC